MNLVRLPVDDRVDRLDVEALQGVELTSTNKSRACYTTLFVLTKTVFLCVRIHYVAPFHHPRRWCGRHLTWLGVWHVQGCVPCGCFGGYSVRETPGPIPNPVVKPYHADGTARGIWWESRTLPDFIYCLWFSACMAENHKRISGCFWTNGSVGILTATGTVMCTLWRDRGLPPFFGDTSHG